MSFLSTYQLVGTRIGLQLRYVALDGSRQEPDCWICGFSNGLPMVATQFSRRVLYLGRLSTHFYGAVVASESEAALFVCLMDFDLHAKRGVINLSLFSEPA